MRKALIISLVMLCWAAVGFASEGAIGIYFDPAGQSCDLDDTNTSPFGAAFEAFVLHTGTDGAGSSQWMAKVPDCSIGHIQYASEMAASGMVPDGNSQSGLGLGYGECKIGTTLLLTITVNTAETTPPCCEWGITPDPRLPSNKIEGADCNFALTFPSGLSHPFNPDQQCACNNIVPTHQSTWGQVKSLWNTE